MSALGMIETRTARLGGSTIVAGLAPAASFRERNDKVCHTWHRCGGVGR